MNDFIPLYAFLSGDWQSVKTGSPSKLPRDISFRDKCMTLSILIVDDDMAIKESTAEFLGLVGYQVEMVSSAEDALNILKRFSPDIVITDIMMHEMDGLELTRYIKENHVTDVIVMTGYSADYSYEEAILAGASDFIFKPFRFEELDLRIKRVAKEMLLRKEHDKMVQKLEKLAITDALTKLHNSRHFFQILKSEIDRHTRYHRPLSLLILDIDFFKHYNDTWGHLEGDKVLMKLGKVISSCLRTMDTAYRYGGEEFTIILPETKLDEAVLVGERIRIVLAEEHFMPAPNQEVSVTISIGTTEYHFPGDSLTSFVKRADRAMYNSKESGRNKVSHLPPPEI